jgi:hypothetical protein
MATLIDVTASSDVVRKMRPRSDEMILIGA